jgi:hypothetical protein
MIARLRDMDGVDPGGHATEDCPCGIDVAQRLVRHDDPEVERQVRHRPAGARRDGQFDRIEGRTFQCPETAASRGRGPRMVCTNPNFATVTDAAILQPFDSPSFTSVAAFTSPEARSRGVRAIRVAMRGWGQARLTASTSWP